MFFRLPRWLEWLYERFSKNAKAQIPYYDDEAKCAYFFAVNQGLIFELKASTNVKVIFKGMCKGEYKEYTQLVAISPNLVCLRLSYGITEFISKDYIPEEKEHILINVTKLS